MAVWPAGPGGTVMAGLGLEDTVMLMVIITGTGWDYLGTDDAVR